MSIKWNVYKKIIFSDVHVGVNAPPLPNAGGSESKSSDSSPEPESPITIINFSLVELSLMIRIMRQMTADYLVNSSYDFTIHQCVKMSGDMILDKLGKPELKNNELIRIAYGKMIEVG